MTRPTQHQFHIPVMGLGFTIDTPVKIARYGINSAISIVEDNLIEQMRAFYCDKLDFPYIKIADTEHDYRAKRITAYLNLVDYMVQNQSKEIRTASFEPLTDITKYFELLPENSPVKIKYNQLQELSGDARINLENELRNELISGSIEVNIMTKVDKPNFDKDGNALGVEFSDALSALRGFANSNLSSGVIFSAGLNPRLYSYCESFPDFYPDKNGHLKKKIILKVSDYRSALVQGKFLAKKGLWVSEYRIESGLNCGGHAFATEGLLMGPILEEFKNKRDELFDEVYAVCEAALTTSGKGKFNTKPVFNITAQGGIGTANENNFFLGYYQLSSIGWGSPFLLVPEVTNVDEETLQSLATAKPDDYFLSHASPLGVPFNNFRKSSSEAQRIARIEKGKAGSPCLKKFLQFNTEFTKTPICTASTKYQYFKLKELKEAGLSEEKYAEQEKIIQEKDCLCEGLSVPALLVNDIAVPFNFNAVTICPGPNLAFFSGVHTLKQMVDHIYGRTNILNDVPRSNVFINELRLYVKYLVNENNNISQQFNQKKEDYINKFKTNLLIGINYYHELAEKMEGQANELFKGMQNELEQIEISLLSLKTATVTV
ncbi:MAG: hypothetical protein K9G64_01415 [Bacteroidia bacterium]|nr:hypothetical protein [Bacteroidia bacterium]